MRRSSPKLTTAVLFGCALALGVACLLRIHGFGECRQHLLCGGALLPQDQRALFVEHQVRGQAAGTVELLLEADRGGEHRVARLGFGNELLDGRHLLLLAPGELHAGSKDDDAVLRIAIMELVQHGHGVPGFRIPG